MKSIELNSETLPFERERFIRLDGTYVDAEVKAIAIKYEEENAVQLIINDITKNIKLEDQLLESEKTLHESQKEARIGTYVWEITINSWKSSKVLDEIFGVDENYERTFDSWNRIVHPDFRAVMAQYVEHEVMTKRSDFDKEYKIVRQDNGQELWVHGKGQLVVDENNKPIKLVGTIINITDRKEAQKTLEEIKILKEGFSKASFEAIFFSEHGVCIEQNKMAEMMFGYTNEEALGRYGTEWLIPEDRDMVMKNMLAGYEEPYEATALRKDGSTFPCQLRGKMMSYYGREIRVTSLYDISLAKQAKAELEKINRLLKIKSRINDLIRTPSTKEKLVQEFCDILVAYGKYRFCWYGELEEITGDVVPKVFAGHEDGYLTAIKIINIGNEHTGKGPTGRAVREGAIIVCNDIANNPLMKPWKELALSRNYYSSVAIPVKLRGKFIGAFTLYSDELNFFSNRNEEYELIEKIAVNLNFALEHNLNEHERIRAERYQILSNNILKTLNSHIDLKEMMGNVVEIIKKETALSAVAMRLKKGDDYPYFVQQGFSDGFLKTENSILSKGCNGMTTKGNDGKPIFECTCGFVVSGRSIPTNELFTNGGSFYTNNSAPLLKIPLEEDFRFQPRNKCIHFGYNSFAIIPIVANEIIVGTLQLNDKSKDTFTLEMIHFFEGVCLNIGTALMRERAEGKLENKMEELVAVNKKLELLAHSNKELEQFAYLASHDLKEPLRTINNYIHLFKNDYEKQVDEQGQKYLNTVITATQRMDNLIKTLLEFSRLGMNRKLSLVDCKNLIEDVIADLDSAISSTGAVIEISEMPKTNLFESEMRQVFQNLITNAIKFRKKDKTPIIRIASEKIKDGWKFSVSDNGIGIDPKYYTKVFEIFQRLHTNKEYEGTGIGLANCKKIVQLHLGEIWIESTEAEGTTFYFTIPKL